jgi:fumarylacetoacetase
VTRDALEPFRLPWPRPAADPQPLPYLDGHANRAAGALDIHLEVRLDTAQRRSMGVAPAPLSQTNFRHQYWTIAQMVTQHTVGGCHLQPGDRRGTGTMSGAGAGEAGAIIELSEGGRKVLKLEGSNEERTFLLDGDAVILRGWCEAPGHARIGFGACMGEVLAAISR